MNDRRWRILAAVLVTALVALLVRGLLGLRRYSSYKVVKAGQTADSVSSYMNIEQPTPIVRSIWLTIPSISLLVAP